MTGGKFASCAALGLALALPACVADGAQAGPEQAQAQALPESDAGHVADALAAADEAQAAGNADRLAHALRVVEDFGAGPLEGETRDPVPAWRAMLADKAPVMRGRPLGPGYRNGELAAGSSEHIEQLFLSGERATIALSAPGNASLSLKVRDARKQQVCGNRGKRNECQWVPIFTQRYLIEIVNNGTKPARYYLVIQ